MSDAFAESMPTERVSVERAAFVDEPVVLSDRAGGLVVRRGDVVSKTHPSGTDATLLATRLRAVAHPLLSEIFLPPLEAELGLDGDRLVTVWPAGEPVDARAPDAAPWEQAAVLLAALHRVPATSVFDPAVCGAELPPSGGPARLGRGIAELLDAWVEGGAVRSVLTAFRCLPDWVRHQHKQPVGMLTHGDWHLGQLVQRADRWWMIDIDDLGVGDPSWDLARPAAYFSAGLLPADVWNTFLSAYRAAGGPAVPPSGDPWASLEVPAQALVVQMAAHSLVKAHRAERSLDEVECALVDTCRRIASISDGGETNMRC